MAGFNWGVPGGHSPQQWPHHVAGKAPQEHYQSSQILGDLIRDGRSPGRARPRGRGGEVKQAEGGKGLGEKSLTNTKPRVKAPTARLKNARQAHKVFYTQVTG